ncbi:hypothetical protein ACWEVP_31870 [Amycolatopsis sp. NPDC003865]
MNVDLGECPVCECPLEADSPSLFWCSEECQAVWQDEPGTTQPTQPAPPSLMNPWHPFGLDRAYGPNRTTVEVVGLTGGSLILWAHNWERCAGQPCCVHNPSDHPLRDAPMRWRTDLDFMERVCSHGIAHPDPDDLSVQRGMVQAHGWCDGCCRRGELT